MVGLLVQLTYGWDQLLSYIPLLLVHMNLAYYIFFSTALLVAWVFSIFVADRFVYWEFAPGGISKRVLFSEGSENFTTPQVETLRQSDDIFVHRVLGLWFLGFGTGDLDVRFGTPGGGQRIYHLRNVWRVGHVEREINRLVGRRAQPGLSPADHKTALLQASRAAASLVERRHRPLGY